MLNKLMFLRVITLVFNYLNVLITYLQFVSTILTNR